MMITAFFLVLWLLPVIVAAGRGVRLRTIGSISLIAVFTGWTIVGWVLALVWALEAPYRGHC